MPSASLNAADATSSNADQLYQRYLGHLEARLPPILAAVATLTDTIESSPLRTAAETLSLLSTCSDTLKDGTEIPLIVGSGVSAFRRWLVLLLERPSAGRTLDPPFEEQCLSDEFDDRKRWIVEAGRVYVLHGVGAKNSIAEHITSSFRDLDTPSILVPVCDEVLGASLQRLAQEGTRFNIFLVDPLYLGLHPDLPAHERLRLAHHDLPAQLRKYSINVTKIPPQAVASCLAFGGPTVPKLVLTAAALICCNGAVVAPLGTCQTAMLARQMNVPFIVATERFKSSELFPLTGRAGDGMGIPELNTEPDNPAGRMAMDVTAPNLITSIVTENGFVGPAQVSDEFMKTWF